MTTDMAISELRQLLGDRLSTAPSVREEHGRDESSLAPRPPDAVAFPTSRDEVVDIVRVCAHHRTAVVPYGAGTSVEGHVHAVEGGITLSLQLMDRILEINEDDLDARVQPGVRRKRLEAELGPRGLFFSVDPGADATIGGMTATGASGTTTVRYGTMRENVLSLEVVLADGRVIRTGTRARKSSAGYDLTHLFIGSEGTLGVITEITVRVRGLPDEVAAAVCTFADLDSAVATGMQVVQRGIPIARCELLDAAAMRAVASYAHLDHDATPTLFLEFHGGGAAVASDADEVRLLAEANGASSYHWAVGHDARRRLWDARHQAYFAILALRPGSRMITTDVCVPISGLGRCMARTIEDLGELPVPSATLGHVADGNFHCCILVDPEDAHERQLVERVTDRLIERAHELGGTCTGEHGIGLGKRTALAREFGSAVNTMRNLKETLDPLGIMNPGKLFLDPPAT